MKELRYISGVTSLRLDEDACVGCGLCETVCPHGVVQLDQRKAHIVDLNGCMECGACAINCPTQAIQVKPGVGCASYIIKDWLKDSPLSRYLSSDCC